MIKGENDWVGALGEKCAFQDFEGSANEIDAYKIVIKDADHHDYTYESTDDKRDPFKVKTARFIAEITSRSGDQALLQNFLRNNPGISYDQNVDTFKVDLERVTYGD